MNRFFQPQDRCDAHTVCGHVLGFADLDFAAARKRAILRFPVSPRAQRRSMEDEVAML